jgi:hypothetical protein
MLQATATPGRRDCHVGVIGSCGWCGCVTAATDEEECLAAAAAAAASAAGGGLFGPEALMRLALDSRTRHLMDDAEFQTMLRGLSSNPALISAYLQDPRMQLVRGPSM